MKAAKYCSLIWRLVAHLLTFYLCSGSQTTGHDPQKGREPFSGGHGWSNFMYIQVIKIHD